IDFADHIAPLQASLGRRAFVLHAGYDHALGGSEIELALDLRGDGAGVEAENALAFVARLDDLGRLLGRLAQLDLECPPAPVSPATDRPAPSPRGGPPDL